MTQDEPYENWELEEPDEAPAEAPESPSELSLPVVGVDKAPTPQQIAEGRVGNGAWNLTDPAYEAARVEIHQQIKADKDERRHFFNEKAKDGLLDAIKLHHSIIKQGLKVMEKIENPSDDDKVTSKDMAILSMAQKSSKELADRGMGRATAAQEESSTTSLLALITKKEG